MKVNLNESQIGYNYQQIMNNQSLFWDVADTEKIYDTLFRAIPEFLSNVKSKEQKVALAVNDLKGNLILAGIVGYHENENKDMPGNWSFEYTTIAEDLEDVKVFNYTDTQFARVATYVGRDLHGVLFQGSTMLQAVLEAVASTLITNLDQNAKEGEEYILEKEGYFQATAIIENGEKVFSIVPDGAMKRLIKDDAAIENN